MTERQRHACAFVALQRLALRRRDPVLAEAAIRLRQTHAANDAQRERFARRDASAPRRAPRTSACYHARA